MAALWDDLLATDVPRAHAAVWTLARSPQDAVPFLRERLKPAPSPPDPKLLPQLVAELDDKRFATRERATRELTRAGRAATPHLRRALEGQPSSELRRRVEALLAALPREAGGGAALRDLWALEALEHAGTAEARALLRDLAGGAPGHPLTEEAKGSLQRLERRAGSKP